MPSEGRRRKKFDQEMRRVQNRNFFAAVVLVIAAVAAVFLVQWVLPSQKPKVFVSVNQVNHSGTRRIPFSTESCATIAKAFQEFLECQICLTTENKETLQLEEESSQLQLSEAITERDVLIVYFNGHLSVDEQDSDVVWIAPEMERPIEKKLSELLESVDQSPAKIKILLLDSGRYSWSPVFPGREPNRFQSTLAEKLASNEWGLSRQFWVITSHSDAEISNVSTPLKCSLFATAIQETLREFASSDSDDADEVDVQNLFDKIKLLTQSYATNFHNTSVQTPVLMKAGIGVVGENASETLGDIEPLRVVWNELQSTEDAAPEDPKTIEFDLDQFSPRSEEDVNEIFSAHMFDALPVESIRYLESFLEHGQVEMGFQATDLANRTKYTDSLSKTERRPEGRPTNFNRAKLDEKRGQIDSLRNALLEFAVILRFRDQMRFWDDNVIVQSLSERLQTPIQISDADLRTLETNPPEINDWLKQRDDLKTRSEAELIKFVNLELSRTDELTAYQAELLGVVSQRYIPLLRLTPPSEKNESPKTTRTIKLKVNYRGQFNPSRQPNDDDPVAGYKSVVQASVQEVQRLAAAQSSESDTARRFRLAAIGSENTPPVPGLVPNIAWKPIRPNIEITRSDSNEFQINPYDEMRMELNIAATAVDNIDLKISPKGEPLDGLKFGFDSTFDPTAILTDIDDSEKITILFQYPQENRQIVGQTFEFELTATDRASRASPQIYPLRVQITNDATYWVKSKRLFANRNDTSARTKLLRWNSGPQDANWQPIVISTLANVKSNFEINLQNNSNANRSFVARLFRIQSFPVGIDEDMLRADHTDWKQVRDFSQWLQRQTLDSNDAFELIGQATITDIAHEETQPFLFTLPPPTDPEEKKPDPATKRQFHIDKGAMLVLFPVDAPNEPAWYQMVKFDPRDSARISLLTNDRLRVKPAIEDVFGDDLGKLPEQLVFPPDQSPAAQLSVISKSGFATNRAPSESMNIQQLLAPGRGARFSDIKEPALLLLDVLGVPNYATYEINGAQPELTPLREHLAGIRIVGEPIAWQQNPTSWSFAPNRHMADQFAWLAQNNQSGVTDVFLNPRASEKPFKEAEKGIKVELFFPFRSKDVLDSQRSGQGDLWWRWMSAKTPFHYPNLRKHIFSISGSGIEAWSEITSHSVEIASDPSGKVLELGQGNETLGQWRFVSQSLGISPAIEANPQKTMTRIPNLKTVVINVDVQKIRPSISLDQIQLELNDQPVKELADFLTRHPHPDGAGQFQFSLYELIQATETPIPKEKTEMEVAVLATDFFGKTTSDQTVVTVEPPPVIKPPPPPVKFTVGFVYDEKPASIHGFEVVQINKKPLKQLGFEQMLRANAPYKDGNLKVSFDAATSTLTFDSLKPGEYEFYFVPWFKTDLETQHSPVKVGTKGKVKVDKENTSTVIDIGKR